MVRHQCRYSAERAMVRLSTSALEHWKRFAMPPYEYHPYQFIKYQKALELR